MTVQTDESSAAAETCSLTGGCHAVLMADCTTLWDRGRQNCAGTPTSVLLTGRHIQSMTTAVKDVRELSPLGTAPACRILADMEMRRRRCISIRGPQSWTWSFAVPEASGGCVGLEWCGLDVVLQTLDEPHYSVLWHHCTRSRPTPLIMFYRWQIWMW